jgi:hypothetical protein
LIAHETSSSDACFQHPSNPAYRFLLCWAVFFFTAAPALAQSRELEGLASRLTEKLAKSGNTSVIVFGFGGPGKDTTELAQVRHGNT